MIRRAIVAALLAAGVGGAARAQEGPVTAYPAAYFASAQPASAYDMLQRLPGFTFDAGDADVRGFAGASGNVLIDGKRRTSKQESLEAVLRRIPAKAVERIELVRAGAPGFDLQGRAMVANVVRRTEIVTQGRLEAGLGAYPDGRTAPRLAAEGSRRAVGRLFEGSASVGREVDDHKGGGRHDLAAPDGSALRLGHYNENKWQDAAEAAIGYEQNVAGGKLRLDGSARLEHVRANIRDEVSFPRLGAEAVGERENGATIEVGGHYERRVGDWAAEGLGLSRWSRTRGRDQADEDGDREIAGVALDGRETVVRGVVRRELDTVSIEAGAEAALNALSSHNTLVENGTAIALPSARVRVAERRGEAFANFTWRMRDDLTIEGGGRIEASRLRQTGDAAVTRSLQYLKPRGLISWRPSRLSEARLEIDRRIGQLDFKDFVSSASLTSNTVTAGNPDLEPDRTWRVALSWEQRFAGTGSVVASIRHDEISGVTDRVPVRGAGVVFDAPGNIGHGVRDEAQLALIAPMDGLGLRRVAIKADLLWRRSRVDDPATGETRPISGEPSFVGTLHLTHDLPAWRLRWGADATLAQSKSEYLFNEVKSDRTGTRVGLFAECRPAPAWNISLRADNLTDGKVERRRERYDGLRGIAPLRRIEVRTMRFGPSASVTVQRAFGG